MKKSFEKIQNFFNNRYLILYVVVIIIAVVYIIRLFNLQIVNGSAYREKSEKRMLRTEKIVASRGEITDRNGIVLATNKLSFDVELYKVRVEVEEQNNAIASLVNILYANGDKVYSTFPINESLDGFNFSSEADEQKWKKDVKLDEKLSFNETINEYIKRYALEGYDKELQIRIIQVKYEGNLNAYSLFNSTTIAKDISEKSVAQIEEKKSRIIWCECYICSKEILP